MFAMDDRRASATKHPAEQQIERERPAALRRMNDLGELDVATLRRNQKRMQAVLDALAPLSGKR